MSVPFALKRSIVEELRALPMSIRRQTRAPFPHLRRVFVPTSERAFLHEKSAITKRQSIHYQVLDPLHGHHPRIRPRLFRPSLADHSRTQSTGTPSEVREEVKKLGFRMASREQMNVV